MVNEFIAKIKQHIDLVTTYAATLLYVEIIYIMFMLLLVYGKGVALTIGFLLTILLTSHILLLYFKSFQTRKIHLVLIEIHAAYAFSFIIQTVFFDHTINFLQVVFVVIRTCILLSEVVLIYLLTAEKTA